MVTIAVTIAEIL